MRLRSMSEISMGESSRDVFASKLGAGAMQMRYKAKPCSPKGASVGLIRAWYSLGITCCSVVTAWSPSPSVISETYDTTSL